MGWLDGLASMPPELSSSLGLPGVGVSGCAGVYVGVGACMVGPVPTVVLLPRCLFALVTHFLVERTGSFMVI